MTNTRSTRSRLRSVSKSRSESLSQSQSLFPVRRNRQDRSLDGGHADRALQASGEGIASLESGSTATLPTDYTVHVAIPCGEGLIDSQKALCLLKGQELLTDGWRRGGEGTEGKLSDLRAFRTLQRGSGGDSTGAEGRVRPGKEVLWYTAGLQYPCTCQLETHRRAWTPTCPPPLIARDDALIPPHQGPSGNPLIGDSIPPWTAPSGLDLDPGLDHLTEFEHRWQSADPRPGRSRKDEASRFGVYPSIAVEQSQSVDSVVTIVEAEDGSESPRSRKLRKGKYRAGTDDAFFSHKVSDNGSNDAPSAATAVNLGPNPPLWGVKVPGQLVRATQATSRISELEIAKLVHDAGVKSKDFATTLKARRPLTERIPSSNVIGSFSTPRTLLNDHTTKDRERKAWWRREVRESDAYGQMWSVIPLPHTLDFSPPPTTARRKRKRHRRDPVECDDSTSISVPDFVLPKYYYSSSPTPRHPFLPDLTTYVLSNPMERVYWIVPIHGPIHIPTYSDHLTDPPSGAPIPSAAILHLDSVVPPKIPRTTPTKSRQSSSLAESALVLDTGGKAKAKSISTVLQWTPELLKHFWTSFLVPLQANLDRPFGHLSVRVSGPKPDPFIDLPPLTPLSVPLRCSKSDGHENQATEAVRAEVGDHLRIYVDAKYALKLRTWLRGVEMESKHLSADKAPDHPNDDAAGEERGGKGGLTGVRGVQVVQAVEEIIKPFSRVRLTLVGMSGQVLIVA